MYSQRVVKTQFKIHGRVESVEVQKNTTENKDSNINFVTEILT